MKYIIAAVASVVAVIATMVLAQLLGSGTFGWSVGTAGGLALGFGVARAVKAYQVAQLRKAVGEACNWYLDEANVFLDGQPFCINPEQHA